MGIHTIVVCLHYHNMKSTMRVKIIVFFCCFYIFFCFQTIDAQRINHNSVDNYFDNLTYFDYLKNRGQDETYVQKIYKFSVDNNYKYGIVRGANVLGALARDRSKYYKSLKYHDTALRISIEMSDTIMMIISFNNQGVVFRRLDEPQLALESHLNALQLAEMCFHKDNLLLINGKCVAENGLGNLNISLGNYEKALDYFNRAIKVEIKNNNKLGIAINKNNIGECYKYLEDYETALKNYRDSYDINLQIQSLDGQGICLNSIGEVFMKLNMPDSAFFYFHKGMNIFHEVGDAMYLGLSHKNIGSAAIQLRKDSLARRNLNKCLAIAKSIGSKYLAEQACFYLSELAELQGDNTEALFQFKQYALWKDTLLNERNSKFITEIQTKYQTERQNHKIDLLNLENNTKSKQIKLFLILLIAIIVVFVLLIILWYQQRRNAKFENTELKQKVLLSQMKPHFIFNVLGSIQSFILKNNPEKASGYISDFAMLTRSVLENSETDLVSLKEEVSALEHYIKLEQMRFANAWDFVISVDSDVDEYWVMIPPMLIQPFVENAIKHGLCNMEKGGHLFVVFSMEKKNLKIVVSDNGMGITKSLQNRENKKHESMAMKIFYQRQKIFHKQHGSRIELNIVDRSSLDSTISGTEVIIIIPNVDSD